MNNNYNNNNNNNEENIINISTNELRNRLTNIQNRFNILVSTNQLSILSKQLQWGEALINFKKKNIKSPDKVSSPSSAITAHTSASILKLTLRYF